MVVWSDELDIVFVEQILELRVLRQKSVSGVDCICPSGFDDFEDSVHSEVGLTGRGRSDPAGFVGLLDEHAVHVGVRVHGDGADAHLLASADDTASDLTAVGDEDLVEGVRVGLGAESDALRKS